MTRSRLGIAALMVLGSAQVAIAQDTTRGRPAPRPVTSTGEVALAAYHAGQGNVDERRRQGGGIRFPETRHYVEKVLDAQQVYAAVYADELGG